MTQTNQQQHRDRLSGSFIGLAVGDALGTTIEFSPRDTYEPVTDLVGGGPFRLKPGQWTDDMSMALCLADSLMEDPALDPGDLMRRFDRWQRLGENSATGHCFDIGITTRAAIRRWRETGEVLAGSTDPNKAGNGSIMRLAPVVLAHAANASEAERVAILQGQTTHGAAECVQACQLLTRILLAAAASGSAEAALTQSADADWSPAIAGIAEGTWRAKTRAQIRASGYVVHTLEAACWAVGTTGSFTDAVLLAVNLGEDADTVGAVAGQIAGAVYGLSAIPERWRTGIHDSDRLHGLADRLLGTGLGG